MQKNLRDKIKSLLDQKLKLNEKITAQEIWISSVNQFVDSQTVSSPGHGDYHEEFSDYNEEDDISQTSGLCATRQVSFSFDGYSEDGEHGEDDSYRDDDSWGQGKSPYPNSPSPSRKTFVHSLAKSPTSSPTKRSQMAFVESPDCSSMVHVLTQSSTRFKMIKLGLQTATTAMEYALENEILSHKNQVGVVTDLNNRIESRTSELLKRSVELEAAVDIKERMRHNLMESQRREVVLEEKIAELEAKLREAHSAESSLHTSEDVMRTKFVQLEFDRSCARAQLVKAKAELADLREEHAHLEKVNAQLNEELAAKEEENIILSSDLDLVEQRLCVVLAQRDELVIQFVKGGHYAVDENGLESLYSAND